MTEKIIVIPREVRGLGNIVEKKELDDYDTFESSITESTDTVMGKDMSVYTMEAVGYRLSLTLGSNSIYYGRNTICTATLTDIDSGAVSGASIKVYVDNTLKDTKTTDSNGEATYNTGYVLSVGSHSIKVVYNTGTEDIVATKTLTVTKRPTVLTINTPAVVYSDEFDVTGTLKNELGNGVVGETVTLHWKVGDGSEQTATATTGSYGAVTFHRSAPTSVTDYKFWMTYAGSDTKVASNTSEITVTVDKETSVLNVTSPVNGQNIPQGDAFQITGSLLDNDGQTISNATVNYTVYKDNSYVGQGGISVGFDGNFTSPSMVLSVVGSYKFSFSYAGNTKYTAVSLDVNVTIGSSYDSIVVTADKNILSYADNEKATLYAQLKKNGSNYSEAGVTITFKQGSTTLGTAQTNSSGLATLTNGYTASGAGDVSITAGDGTLVSETFSVQDCYYYDDCSSDKHSNWDTTSSTDTITYDSTNKCYNIVKTADGDSYIYFTDSLIPRSVKITYDIKINDFSKNTQPRLGLSTGDEQVTGRFVVSSSQTFIAILRHNGSTWNEFTSTSVSTSVNTWYTVEITVDGNSWTIKLYNGSTLLGTASATVTTLSSNANRLILDNAYENTASISIKNMKVKSL